MRICLVGPLPPHRGGVAQHADRLLRAFEAEGHDVDPVSYRIQYPRFARSGDPATPRRTDRHLIDWFNPWTWRRAAARAAAADLVVVEWVTPFHGLLHWWIARSARCSVFVVHNATPHEWFPLARLITSTVLSISDGIVVHSESVRHELCRMVTRVPAAVVGLPPSLEVRVSEPPPASPFRLLFLGYIRPYKGLDLLVDAIRKASATGMDWHLTIAGESWFKQGVVEAMVADSGVSDRITTQIGYVDDIDVPDLINGSHVLVLPYRSASQSGLVPLAIAAGRFVVASDAGGLSEQVGSYERGLICHSGDVDSLVEALLDVQSRLATTIVPRSTGVGWAEVARQIRLVGTGQVGD